MNIDEYEKMDEQGATHWWYEARRSLLHHDLKKYANGRTNLKILDLACACGHNYSICKNYGEYNGIDI